MVGVLSMPPGAVSFRAPRSPSTGPAARWYPMGDLGQVSDQQDKQKLPEDAALRAIVEGVESETGEQFFASLVQRLASALRAQYAFVSELSDDRQRFRTRALWGRGAFLPNIDVPLAGTPCEGVLHGQMSHFPERLQELFPADRALGDWGVHSYCGVPLVDPAGVVVGHLAICDDKPMWDGPRGPSVMRIFAARARAEISRLGAERAMRESEALYRDLYEHAPLAYFTFGSDGRLRRWNARGPEITGYTDEELRGMRALDFHTDAPENREAFARLEREVFQQGRDLVAEVEGRRKDGSLYWARVSLSPLRDEQGHITGARSIAQDVTELHQAQQAVRESEARLSAIIESALDPIIVTDQEGRIVLLNLAAEMVGTPVMRLGTPAAARSLAEAMEDIRTGRKTFSFSEPGLKSRRLDGEEFEFEAALSCAQVGGRPLYTIYLRDLGERRRLESEQHRLQLQSAYLQEEIKAVHNFEEIVGRSAVLQRVLSQVDLVAATDSSVLISGETGTGKELVARAIHARSGRRERPLVKVNCAALPSGLVESELFGHEKGAFTGATERRTGRFELAHGGTIFLDEVGELPPETQVKLLRVLQEREFERVGGSQTVKVDVRVIAATNRDLPTAVAEGTFRQDLYYRLNVFPVTLPPLRERPEDIPPLVHYFVARYRAKIGRKISRVPQETMARLGAYAWPGNVRELENVIERAVILSPGADLEVAPELLPASVPAAAPRSAALTDAAPARSAAPADAVPLALVERDHILSVLRRTNWRVDGPRGAARLLNMHPSTLRSRMQKLGIRRSEEQAS